MLQAFPPFKTKEVTMRTSRIFILLFVLAVWALMPVTVDAADWIKQGDEMFYFEGGAFFPAFETKLRVDSASIGEGTDIDLENDLDFNDRETTYRLGGYWRFLSRHRIAVSYFNFNRDASATLNKEITIGDEVYPIGARVESEFKFQVIPITYMYSFMKREKFEFSGGLGLHWYRIDFKAKGDASLGNEDLDADITAKADVPLPLLGLRFDYHFTPKWSAGLLGEIFWLNTGSDTFKFSGSVVNLRLSTEYWFFNNLGLGVALNWFDLSADVEDDEWKGKLDYNYWGPQIYVAVRF
jgi:hypothetical protein